MKVASPISETTPMADTETPTPAGRTSLLLHQLLPLDPCQVPMLYTCEMGVQVVPLARSTSPVQASEGRVTHLQVHSMGSRMPLGRLVAWNVTFRTCCVSLLRSLSALIFTCKCQGLLSYHETQTYI